MKGLSQFGFSCRTTRSFRNLVKYDVVSILKNLFSALPNARWKEGVLPILQRMIYKENFKKRLKLHWFTVQILWLHNIMLHACLKNIISLLKTIHVLRTGGSRIACYLHYFNNDISFRKKNPQKHKTGRVGQISSFSMWYVYIMWHIRCHFDCCC